MFFKILNNCVVTSIFINYLLIGKTNLNCEKQNVWPAVPVLCFQNNLSVESAVEVCIFSMFFFKSAILLNFVKLNPLLLYLYKQTICGYRFCVKIWHLTVSSFHPNPYLKQTTEIILLSLLDRPKTR